MFDEKFIQARKRDLLKEKERLAKEITARKKFENYGDSEDDNAQEVQSFEENLSIRSNLERLLADVNKALQKIDNGTYGKCERGPEEIEKERLVAFPSATVCIKHQKEQERPGARAWFKPWTWKR